MSDLRCERRGREEEEGKEKKGKVEEKCGKKTRKT